MSENNESIASIPIARGRRPAHLNPERRTIELQMEKMLELQDLQKHYPVRAAFCGTR